MKKFLVSLFLVTLVLGTAGMASAISFSASTPDDLWGINNIQDFELPPVTNGGVFSGSSIQNLFGAEEGTVLYEEKNTLFTNEYEVLWVKWHTKTDVTVKSISLLAANDNDAQQHRSMARFWVAYDDGAGNWVPLVDNTSPSYVNGVLQFAANVGEITSDYFMAGFWNPWDTGTGRATDWGMRVIELDAYSNAIPEPTTLLLLGIGLIGVAGLSRKKFFK